MPDVPNVPGVPALSSYAGNNIALAFADGATLAATLLFQPTWGVFMKGVPVITPATIFSPGVNNQINAALAAVALIAPLIGVPNIVPVIASTAEFDYSVDAPISNYPQEGGKLQSYNKIQLPFDLKMKLACSGGPAQLQAFQSTLDALRRTTATVDVVTPEKVFANVNCKHVDFRRRADRGVELLVADVWFEEVPAVAAIGFTSTMSPANASQQSIGNVQPQAPTAAITQLFGGEIGSPF